MLPDKLVTNKAISELSPSSCALQAQLAQVTALTPRLEQLSAEAGALGAVPSLKDNLVVVSAHHASTLQQLQGGEQEIQQGNAAVLLKSFVQTVTGRINS